MATKKYLDEAGAAYLVSKILGLLSSKVSLEEGKGLSEEDFTTILKSKLEGLENYSLPLATNENLGGVKVGSGLAIDSATGELSVVGGGVADTVNWDNIQNKPNNLVYEEDISIMSSEDIDALFES